jgi:hypothetical protein
LLERVDGHPIGFSFGARIDFLLDLFRETREPVFNFNKCLIVIDIVVNAIADVQRPVGIPVWPTGATTNVLRCGLNAYLLKDVLNSMINEVSLLLMNE